MSPPPLAVLRGRIAALGTLHGKEEQIRPALSPLGLRVVVEPIDTNRFGTFDGTVPRLDPPEQVVAAKATAAAESAGSDLGLASEGSFFAHPAAPWVTTNLELVALVDRTTATVVTGRYQQFAPWVRAGMDLRAHRCADRRTNIAAAAADLATRLRRRCDDCGSRGVGPSRTESGRPCGWCGAPTLALLREVSSCPACGAESAVEVREPADPATCPSCNP